MYDWCDSGLCGDKVTWELLGDGLYIDGEGKMDDFLPNRSIWEPLAWLVRSVTISRGVTSIGDYAFCGFPDLTGIDIPETVTEIGEGAFADCPKLRQIRVSPGNRCYFSREGMLINSHTKRIVWPQEHSGRKACWFAVDENDCIFRIETGCTGLSGFGGIASFGDSNTLIEIRESGGTILDIECIYLEPTLHEPNLFLPDYRSDPELEETECFYCPDYEYGERHLCLVNVVRDKMEIFFGEELENVCCYHTDGRVEYYCDEEKNVVVIRVSDLTEEEYNILR